MLFHFANTLCIELLKTKKIWAIFNSMEPNTDIYRYSDYRAYMRDWYASCKEQMSGFTWQYFAAKSGFSSAGALKLVSDGKRNLGLDAAKGVAGALRLKGKAQDYFMALVRFAQAASLPERLAALRDMDSCRPADSPALIDPARRGYLEHWYYPVVRELVGLEGFREDPAWIAAQIRPVITVDNAASALSFLEAGGFLVRRGDGSLEKAEPTLAAHGSSGDPVFSALIRSFHLAMMDRAKAAVSDMTVDERLITNTTLSLTREGYAAALERVERLRQELLSLASADLGADCIYQLTLNLFPLTSPIPQGSAQNPEVPDA